jgi:SAM-dependent methyltransferase
MVAAPNEEMRKAWDGPEGESWAAHAEQYEAVGRRQRARLLDAAALVSGERVLDIGCGTGASTREAGRAVAPGVVVGVDLSSAMLARARQQCAADGLTNVTFLHADAQVHPFEPQSFDVVISSSGAMFFDDKAAAFGNINRALRPGGRMVLMAWQVLGENEWLMTTRVALAMGRDLPMPPPGAPGPFGLADRDQVTDWLTEAGFEDIAFADVREPMWFGADTAAAMDFLSVSGPRQALLADLSEAEQAIALSQLHAALEAHETDEGVLLGSASWLITARARD